jgi:hypothetical protein
MRLTRDKILKALNSISVIIFIGLCIDAGGFIFNTLYVLFYNPLGVKQFWNRIDMSGLYNYDYWIFILVNTITIVISLLKAYLFYIIVKIFMDNQLDLSKPFNKPLGKYLEKITQIIFSTAVVSIFASRFYYSLSKKGIAMPTAEELRFDGDDEWFFMSMVLYVFSQIFKKGIELQSENELTV